MSLIGTGASGIRAQQQVLDIVANNLANANTIGFKADRANFAETLATLTSPGNLSIGTSVTEALNIGGGGYLNGVGTDFSQGLVSQTDNVWDLSIQGDGFFQVTTPNGETAYTRAGSFKPDALGQLVDDSGNFLAVRIPQQTTNINVSPNGEITGTLLGKLMVFGNIGQTQTSQNGEAPYTPLGPFYVDDSGQLVDGNRYLPSTLILVPREVTEVSISTDGEIKGLVQGKSQVFGQLTLAAFSNQEGLIKAGDNLFKASVNSGNVEVSLPGQAMGKVGKVSSKTLEQSNVDLAMSMTDLIQVQRAYQMNSRMLQNGDKMWELANSLRR